MLQISKAAGQHGGSGDSTTDRVACRITRTCWPGGTIVCAAAVPAQSFGRICARGQPRGTAPNTMPVNRETPQAKPSTGSDRVIEIGRKVEELKARVSKSCRPPSRPGVRRCRRRARAADFRPAPAPQSVVVRRPSPAVGQSARAGHERTSNKLATFAHAISSTSPQTGRESEGCAHIFSHQFHTRPAGMTSITCFCRFGQYRASSWRDSRIRSASSAGGRGQTRRHAGDRSSRTQPAYHPEPGGNGLVQQIGLAVDKWLLMQRQPNIGRIAAQGLAEKPGEAQFQQR